MARRKKGEKINGWIALDKPAGITSTDAVTRVRRLFDAQKAGHAGTLDPLATGVLAIALGEATKTIPYAVDTEKSYRFTATFGEARDTDDAEGAVVATSEVRPADAAIVRALAGFIGDIMQTPPAYSAVKVAGERAYDLARAGETVALEARPAFIRRLELVERLSADAAVFDMVCGKGVYVRSFVRDIALKLGTYAHVTALRRTRVGPFALGGTISLDALEAFGHGPAALTHLLPVETALDDIPALAVTESEVVRLKNGQPVMVRGQAFAKAQALIDAAGDETPTVLIRTMRGEPVAIAELVSGEFVPVRVFNL